MPCLIALIIALTACDSQTTRRVAVARDSAGIRIVENGTDPAVEEWVIDTIPFLVIGGDEADAAQQLFEVSDAFRLHDGRIVVANGGNSEIRIYSSGGRLDGTMGRRGEGPGEFGYVPNVTLNDAGHVVGWDSGVTARNEFTLDGEFLRRVETAPAALPAMRESTLALRSGSVVIKALDPASVMSMPETPRRSRVSVVLVKDGATSADTLGEWPDESLHYPEIEGRRMALHTLFTPQTLISAGGPGDIIVVGETAKPEYAVFDSTGGRRRVVRWTATSRTARDADISMMKEEWTATRGARLPEAAANRLLAAMTIANPVPEYADLEVDTEGFIWIAQYALPSDSIMNWLVFDESGAMVANATTSPDFSPLEIGCDYILAHAIDEVGVERLEVHRLERSMTCRVPRQPPSDR